MPFLIPFLITALVGGFAASVVQGLIKLAIAIGVGFVVYQGLDILFTSVMNQVTYNFGTTPLTGILVMLKLDKCLNVLASAVATKFALQTGANGLRKLVLK